MSCCSFQDKPLDSKLIGCFFRDKCSAEFNAETYFTKKALERRKRNNLPPYDYRDLPVCDRYIKEVGELVDSLGYTTRWLNGIAVYTSDSQLELLRNLNFVSKIIPVQSYEQALASEVTEIDESFSEELLKKQTERMGILKMQQQELDGKGVVIAIFDAGFPMVNTSKAFEHIRNRNGILATYDFVKKREEVYA